MSDHSLEELERQVQQARSRKEEADRSFSEATMRLHAKRCENSGLIGKFVTHRGKTLEVTSLKFWESKAGPVIDRYIGPRILKDGSRGQKITIYASDKGVEVHDHPLKGMKAAE